MSFNVWVNNEYYKKWSSAVSSLGIFIHIDVAAFEFKNKI